MTNYYILLGITTPIVLLGRFNIKQSSDDGVAGSGKVDFCHNLPVSRKAPLLRLWDLRGWPVLPRWSWCVFVDDDASARLNAPNGCDKANIHLKSFTDLGGDQETPLIKLYFYLGIIFEEVFPRSELHDPPSKIEARSKRL